MVTYVGYLLVFAYEENKNSIFIDSVHSDNRCAYPCRDDGEGDEDSLFFAYGREWLVIFCTLLNPALDIIYSVDEFRSGATFTDVPARIYPAGKGLNVAKVVHVLGEDVCVVGLIGDHDHHRFTEYLIHRGIQHLFYSCPGSVRVNSTIIEQNAGFVSHIASTGVSLPLRIQDEFIQFIHNGLSGGDLWCFSGSLPKGFDDDVYSKLIKECSSKGIETIFDSRGNAFRMGIRAKPMMIKPNLTELEEFFDEQIRGVRHIALKGKRLLDMGIRYVFISLGADGMIAIHENDCLLCSAPQIEVIDTVGCGDALVGGLIVARKRNFSFTEACRMAIACGVSNAMHDGPGEINRDEVWQIMEDVQITAV